MNYTELKTNIQDTIEMTFSDDQLAMFVQLAENKIYNTVQLPALRKSQSGTLTTSNQYLSTPSDFLYAYSLSVTDGDGGVIYLNQKDSNFIREAYPKVTDTGVPKYYAQFDVDSFILGPTPDDAYTVDIHYGYYPESIVTAGNTWLGDNFDNALLCGALVEAARFQKAEQDIIAMYDKLYIEAITLLKSLGDGKLRQDTYRTTQVRNPVT